MAISFNTDSLSTQLRKVTPSTVELKTPKIKTSEINNAIDTAIPEIKSKITNAVDNFKNIKTGAIPEIPPNFNPTAYFEPIDFNAKASIASLGDIRSKINIANVKKEDLLNKQFSSIDVNKISTDELAKFQGDLFKDVKSSVGSISNTQLRDFNIDSLKQQKFVNGTTTDIVKNARTAAEKGIGDASKATTQIKSIDSLDSLVNKKNIFI
tara:strand:- start:1678 stop:2307 length:630 start_codon:yes stop_codon:yes gene_type:complete